MRPHLIPMDSFLVTNTDTVTDFTFRHGAKYPTHTAIPSALN